MSFETAFRFTSYHEGGHVDDPRDRGHETKYGKISKRSYPVVDIKALTLIRRRPSTSATTGEAASCERMPPKIAIAVFDAAVHHYLRRPPSLLQRR